jgi:uncharacterized membrane protein
MLLPVWTYVALTVLLLFVSLQTFDVRGAPRTRVAIVTAIDLVGYIITVYLISFLTYTPLDVDHVRGVQGRYFVIALPMAAIFIAATINVALRRGLIATMALTGSLISGIASFQALLEAHCQSPNELIGVTRAAMTPAIRTHRMFECLLAYARREGRTGLN